MKTTNSGFCSKPPGGRHRCRFGEEGGSVKEIPDGICLSTLRTFHSPAYDFLCTTLHLPAESRMALDLFGDNFETPFFQANGFHGYADFMELANRFGIEDRVASVFLRAFEDQRTSVHAMIGRSFMSKAAKDRYLGVYEDRLRAMRQQ